MASDRQDVEDSALGHLRRLEALDELLPALADVLDIRDVFEQISAIARNVINHDLLSLLLLSEDKNSIVPFAVVGDTIVHPETVPLPEYLKWMATATWDHVIHADVQTDPLLQGIPPVQAGYRGVLSVPIRLRREPLGMMDFWSMQPDVYTHGDVLIARRIADHISLALSHQRLAEQSLRAAALRERAANLEMLDGLLATLTGVLDIREVFDRVSAIAHRVLPHDALSIAEVIENGERVRIHASHGLGNLPEPFDIPAPDPTMVTEPWDFRLIDDVRELPQYFQGPGHAAGMRSMMFVAIRLEGRLFGGLNFYSKTVGRYVQDDVLLARRITDHVALAISHRRLAEQARRTEELRARTTNLELLDVLLAALIDTGELPDVFGRISAIAKKVLPHQAAALMVRLADGRHARVYASSGFPVALPETTEVPEELLQNPDWEHDIFDDLSLHGPRYAQGPSMGLRSLLRVPIRLDGKFAGALVFFAAELSAFKPADILVARRMADRMAVTLARDREIQASRRADEATARASKLEARVRGLTEELDARTGYRRVVGESAQWRRVLTQATRRTRRCCCSGNRAPGRK